MLYQCLSTELSTGQICYNINFNVRWFTSHDSLNVKKKKEHTHGGQLADILPRTEEPDSVENFDIHIFCIEGRHLRPELKMHVVYRLS